MESFKNLDFIHETRRNSILRLDTCMKGSVYLYA